DGKDAVPRLPLEAFHSTGSLVDPSRGFSLDFLDHQSDSNIRFEFGEQVDMVRYPADLQQGTVLSPDDAAHVFVERLPEILENRWIAVLCRKYDVIEEVGESCGHTCLLSAIGGVR